MAKLAEQSTSHALEHVGAGRMSSGLVRSCISAVVENTPSGHGFERSDKLKQLGEEILLKSTDKGESFDKFSDGIVRYINKEIGAACTRLKAASSKRSSVVQLSPA